MSHYTDVSPPVAAPATSRLTGGWRSRPTWRSSSARPAACSSGGAVAYLLLLIRAVLHGDAPYRQFLAWSATPGIVILNVVTFAFVTYHAVTFFQAAPQAMVIHVGRKRVPAQLVLFGHYAAWVVASAVIGWLIAGTAV